MDSMPLQYTSRNNSFSSNEDTRNGTNHVNRGPDVGRTSTVHIAVVVSFYYKLTVLALGLIGNVLTIIVMRKVKGPVTTRIVLMALALSDSAYLVFSTPHFSSSLYFTKKFASVSLFTCRYIRFVQHFFPSLSFWLVAILTMERCLAVTIPLKVKIISSTKILMAVLIVLVLAYVSWDIFVLFNYDIRNVLGRNGVVLRTACIDNKENYDLIITIKTFFDVLTPILITVFCNCVIGIVIIVTKRNQKTLRGGNTRKEETASQLLVTLFVISLAFVILCFPLWFYLKVGRRILGDEIFENINNPYFRTADSSQYTNFGINFYLYVAFTTVFRNEIKRMLSQLRGKCGCMTHSRTNSTVPSTNNTDMSIVNTITSESDNVKSPVEQT